MFAWNEIYIMYIFTVYKIYSRYMENYYHPCFTCLIPTFIFGAQWLFLLLWLIGCHASIPLTMNQFVCAYIICMAFSLPSCSQLHHHKQCSHCALVLRREKGTAPWNLMRGMRGTEERLHCVCGERLPLAKGWHPCIYTDFYFSLKSILLLK